MVDGSVLCASVYEMGMDEIEGSARDFGFCLARCCSRLTYIRVDHCAVIYTSDLASS